MLKRYLLLFLKLGAGFRLGENEQKYGYFFFLYLDFNNDFRIDKNECSV